MARRRYISTDISTDKTVNKMAMKYGDFAALFYTWLIPHIEDNCEITGDAEELLAIVCPWRRDKTVEDISEVVKAMTEFKLVIPFFRNDKEMLLVEPESFYKYQSYISKPNRDYSTKERRETPRNTEEHRGTPENAVSPPPPPSLSPSLPPPPPPMVGGGNSKEIDTSKTGYGDIKRVYEKSLGLLTQTPAEDITHFLDDGIEPDVIIEAIKETSRQGKKWKYTIGILNNCLIDNAKTLEQYIARTLEFKNGVKGKTLNNSPPQETPKYPVFRPDANDENYKLFMEMNSGG